MKRSLIILFAVFAAGGVDAQSDLQTVATVRLTKTEPITVKQLKSEIETLEKATGRTLNVTERREVLDSMINQRLALQGAERDKISVSESEVNQQLTELRNQLALRIGRNPSDAEFADAIKQQTGMDLAAFRDNYKKQLTVQKYLLEKKRDILQSGKPPAESEIKAFYEKNSSDFVQPETAEFSALFFPYKSDSEKAQARAEANRLLKEINGNASTFDEKVLQGRSPNTSYTSTTSQLLPRNAANAPDDFIDAVFKLEQGKVSGLLEMPEGGAKGFFIIKITGKYPKKMLGLEDIILNVPPDLQMQLQGRPLTVRMFILAGLSQQKQQETFIKAQEELIADLRKGQPFSINEQFLNY
ncbi:MAG: peptidyl-prolyl cis-trans isomerase [Spirochaetaceae bacterium]|jgi:hypothetical protein|nr:peptidyl-prolyl cis-trans isomerase [Spirochaetaceae bacterium]